MSLPKIRDEFFLIENFIDEKTCNAVIKYFEYLVENKVLQWNEISFYGSQAMGYWPSDDRLKLFGLEPDFFSKLKQKIKSTTEDLLGFEVTEVSYHAQRWIDGAFADYHSDNSDEHGNPTAFERSKYAVFIYLNDVDDNNGAHTYVKESINDMIYSSDYKATKRIDEKIIEIRVKDQGIGVSEENIERIFERFYRVDPARSRATGGTGLGLSIVKHVVGNHGGEVKVWSVVGVGSTFSIRLPISTEREDL